MGMAKPEPSAKDWRSIMNPVKNQGHCGSCWAFGAIGAMEAAWYLAGNDRVVLSEQMLVDCGPGMGCDGGWVDSAFDHLIKNGAEAETDYPYTAGLDEVAGTCQYDNLPSLPPCLIMTEFTYSCKVSMLLPNPLLIMVLMPSMSMSMTTSDTMRVV